MKLEHTQCDAFLLYEGTVNTERPASPHQQYDVCTSQRCVNTLVNWMQLHNSSACRTCHDGQSSIIRIKYTIKSSYFRSTLFELITNNNLKLLYTFSCKLFIIYQFFRVTSASILRFFSCCKSSKKHYLFNEEKSTKRRRKKRKTQSLKR